jgi:hypothetical protein
VSFVDPDLREQWAKDAEIHRKAEAADRAALAAKKAEFLAPSQTVVTLTRLPLVCTQKDWRDDLRSMVSRGIPVDPQRIVALCDGIDACMERIGALTPIVERSGVQIDYLPEK